MVATVDRWRAAEDIVEFGRRMRARGLIVAMEGNLSARVGPDRILTTPASRDKGELQVSDLVLVDSNGTPQGPGRASTELDMHLAIYAEREDVAAVVHGHPPYATAFAASGQGLEMCLLPEVVVALGAVPLSEYGTPSTVEVPRAVRALVRDHDALLLRNHGAVCVGRDPRDAFYKLETVEQLATITHLAKALGGVKPLDEQQVRRLMEVRSVYGLDRPVAACRAASADEAAAPPAATRGPDAAALRKLVAEEIARVLGG